MEFINKLNQKLLPNFKWETASTTDKVGYCLVVIGVLGVLVNLLSLFYEEFVGAPEIHSEPAAPAPAPAPAAAPVAAAASPVKTAEAPAAAEPTPAAAEPAPEQPEKKKRASTPTKRKNKSD